MAKRKADDEDAPVRRSSRQKSTNDAVTPRTETPRVNKKVKVKKDSKPVGSKPGNTNGTTSDEFKQVKKESTTSKSKEDAQPPSPTRRQYWLMKAEPESRIEKGKDIKFSIDDLAAKKEPEPWDGIRNFVARNHMRNMKKGDLAFFYHSSCKVPGIVGTMEIVEEHSPDMTAQDPKAVYYDAKDTDPDKPKWSVVHVEYRSKLKVPITLTTLRELAARNDGLQNLQMLKQTRLSVSKVEPEEWAYLMKWEDDAVANADTAT